MFRRRTEAPPPPCEVGPAAGSLGTRMPPSRRECVKHRIQCSVIGIGAELHILRQLAKDTHGTYGVCVNEQHYRDLLYAPLPPPRSFAGPGPAAPGVTGTGVPSGGGGRISRAPSERSGGCSVAHFSVGAPP